MSTNKLTHLRRWGTLKNQYRSTKNKNGRDKCYVYKNHITKIIIISHMTRGSDIIIYKSLIYYKGVVELSTTRASRSLHSKGCCSLSPTSIPHCLYKDTNTIWECQTIPHIYFTYTFVPTGQELMNIMLITYIPYVYPPSIFGIPPPPHLLGPPPPVSPLL